MPQPGAPSRVVLAVVWMVVGAAMIAVPGWLGWTRWRAILEGNPTLLAAAILCAAGGLVALAWAVASLFVGARHDRELRLDRDFDRDHAVRRTPAQLRRRAKWRIGLAVPALAVCLFTVAVLAWARPFQATDIAVSALQGTDRVAVSDLLTWYELTPVRTNKDGNPVKPTTGLVFSPGARVDARAYAHILRPLAEAGFLVVVLKEPLGVALADPEHAGRVLDVHPDIRHWVVGGHSLGGVAAASFADQHGPQVQGLLLYGSYPSKKLTRTDLRVLSISGAADGLTTPADIAASKANLPRATTTFVAVKGGVHAYFGDYGNQPGDGTPTVNRAKAQAEIIQATRALLVAVSAPPAKRK